MDKQWSGPGIFPHLCYDEWDAQDAIIETRMTSEVIPGTPAELDEAGNVLAEAVLETRTLIRAAGSNVIQRREKPGSVYAFRKRGTALPDFRATIAKAAGPLHDRADSA